MRNTAVYIKTGITAAAEAFPNNPASTKRAAAPEGRKSPNTRILSGKKEEG